MASEIKFTFIEKSRNSTFSDLFPNVLGLQYIKLITMKMFYWLKYLKLRIMRMMNVDVTLAWKHKLIISLLANMTYK